MRADEYVVQELLKAQKLLEETRAANIFLREELLQLKKKYDFIKSLFFVEETSDGKGYKLCTKGIGFSTDTTICYEWDKEKLSEDFINIINALDLELPKTKELENDQELVKQAMEKVEELKAEQESENK